MTIAFVSMIRDSWGGSEELWYETALLALANGDKVVHSGFRTDNLHQKKRELQARGAKILLRKGLLKGHHSEAGKMIKLGFNYIRNRIRNPFDDLFKHHPDVVVYTGTAYSIAKEMFLLSCLDRHNCKFFIIAQLNDETSRSINDKESAIIKKAYQRSENVFFVSKRNIRTAEHHLTYKIPNADVIRNPVNLKNTEPLAFPSKEITRFAMVGNLLTIHKGQDIALGCLGKLEWKHRKFHLNIYGSGPDENYLKSLIDFYGLTNQVTFHGHVNDIRSVWENNHILLMPSHMEGMPLAIVEAMLCGRPVIATDVGGATEWITDGINGFIAQAPSINSFSETLEIAWNRKDAWQAMGDHARETATKLYDEKSGITLYNLITNS